MKKIKTILFSVFILTSIMLSSCDIHGDSDFFKDENLEKLNGEGDDDKDIEPTLN